MNFKFLKKTTVANAPLKKNNEVVSSSLNASKENKTKKLKGYLDLCDENGVQGWVIDENNPDKPVEIEVIIDGELITQTTADIFRQDLLDAGIGNGSHGFHISMPKSFFDGKKHTIEIKEVLSGQFLSNSPKVFILSAIETAILESTLAGNLEGNLEECDINGIRGWVIDKTNPEKAVKLDVFIDDKLVTQITANIFRQDLLDAGIGNGKHAFNFPTPDSFFDGMKHNIEAKNISNNFVLSSNKIIFGQHSPYVAVLKSCWPWSSLSYQQNNSDLNETKLQLHYNGLTLLNHYNIYGKKENREKGDNKIFNEIQHATGCEKWLVEEMVALSFYEPMLDATRFNTPLVNFDPENKMSWAEYFSRQNKYLSFEEYDYVFLLPWLKHGGADLAALLHIQAAAEKGQVLVITTEPVTSEWASRLPENADLLPFGEILKEIPQSFQAKMLYALLVAVKVVVVHVINSHLGWYLVENHGDALTQVVKLYVSLYCYDYQLNGEPVGYARRLITCGHIPHRIFTDNSAFKEHAATHYGVDKDNIFVLNHPMNGLQLYPQKIDFSSNKILWASRLDRQKQPLLLLEIAKKLPQFEFCVFGSSVTDGSDWGEQVCKSLHRLPNVRLMGGFSSFDEVLNENYLLFLYTSKWDGLPNIVLEAISAGLLVVAPAIAGLKTDLGTERCVLVNNESEPSGYVNAINWVLANHKQAETIRRNGFDYVETNHTWKHFLNQLEEAQYFISTAISRNSVEIESLEDIIE